MHYLSGMGDEPQKTANNGQFLPGNPGRQLGTQNRLTKTVKETVLAVFNDLQDDPKSSLMAFAKKYPRDFYAIAARLIPTEVQGDLKAVFQVEQITGMVIKKKGIDSVQVISN